MRRSFFKAKKPDLDSDQDRDLIMMEDEANKQKGIHSVPNFQFEGCG